MSDEKKADAPERPHAITDGEAEGIAAGDSNDGAQAQSFPCTMCLCTSPGLDCTCSGHDHALGITT